MLGYLVYGTTRTILDGLRVVCFILGCLLVGGMLGYARSLWRYTVPVEWAGRQRGYFRRWLYANRRLLGRIMLCFSWVFTTTSIVGTEIIRRWHHDMGYWRLPCNLIALSFSVAAVYLLMWWNSLEASDRGPGH